MSVPSSYYKVYLDRALVVWGVTCWASILRQTTGVVSPLGHKFSPWLRDIHRGWLILPVNLSIKPEKERGLCLLLGYLSCAWCWENSFKYLQTMIEPYEDYEWSDTRKRSWATRLSSNMSEERKVGGQGKRSWKCFNEYFWAYQRPGPLLQFKIYL